MTGPRIMSGDEWEQSQYLTGTGTRAQIQGRTTPDAKSGISRILTGDEWEQAQSMTAPALKAWKLPTLPPIAAAPRDALRSPFDKLPKGKPLAPFDIKDPMTYANPVLRQVVNPALDNPLTTVGTAAALATPGLGQVVGLAMAGSMVHTIASYGWQKAAELTLSPDDRKRAEADPDRISGEAAAVQAAMLGLAPLIHVGVKGYKNLDVSGGMMDARGLDAHGGQADITRSGQFDLPRNTEIPVRRPGVLNATFADDLQHGAEAQRAGLAHGARVPTEAPAGFVAPSEGVTLKSQPKRPPGFAPNNPFNEVPDATTKVKPVATEAPSEPLAATADARNALTDSVHDYQAERLKQDEADLSAARSAAAEKIAKADAMRPRRRPASANFFESDQGAETLGAMAGRHGLPESSNPYHPDMDLAQSWAEGHQSAVATHPEAATQSYPDGFSMGGDLTDNRIPGAGELPATAQGVDGLQQSHPADIPAGATPETIAMANALKPSRFRGHSPDELANAALDAQTAIEQAQAALAHGMTRHHAIFEGSVESPREGVLHEDRGIEAAEIGNDSTHTTNERALAAAKARLSQIEREFALRGVSGDQLAEVMQAAKEQRMEREGMAQDQSLAAHSGADDPFGEHPPADHHGIDRSQFNVDDGIHSRLLNTRDGADIGTVGSFLKGQKVRALFADVLDTPVVKLSEPPGGTPDGVEYKGARGTYHGRPTIFVAAQSADEFIPTLLEEAAHELRVQRGRVDTPQDIHADGFNVSDYEKLPAEVSAQKMVDHALSLRDEPAPASEPVAAGSAPAQAGLTPVEGTGELKTRGLAAGVEQKAVANKLTTTLGDLPEYRQISMAEQATRATDLLSSDPALARRVALGEVPAPDGLLPESVFTAVENKAIADGDVATIRDLATGKLTSDATTMGQRIRALAERDPESPVGAIQKVMDARTGGAKKGPSTEDTVALIRKQLEHLDVKKDAWADFINSLRC